jgi:hypothetical protein
MRRQCIFAALAVGAVAALAADDAIVAPPPVSVTAADGQRQFRLGKFPEAARAFALAAETKPSHARAWWGLGRVAEVQFQKDRARDLFAKAYRLDPRDSDIVFSYLDRVVDPAARAVLLRNLIALDPQRAPWALARLAIEQRLAGRPAARLAGDLTSYQLPLAAFRPAGAAQDGLIVMVRVNSGKPLRMILDTGARGILLDARAAKGLGLEPIAASQVRGFGDGEAGDSQLNLARSLAVGNLHFEDCLIEVSPRRITPGADGILGAGLFEAFRMRVDARHGVMELTPSDGDPRPSNAIGLQSLLLLKTVVGGREGWFLLDSGAAYSTVARELVSPVLLKGAANGLIGVQGALAGAYRLGPLNLEVGGRRLVDPSPLAVDLRPISTREGVEISGILGYSALAARPFTIDLRHGAVTFE